MKQLVILILCSALIVGCGKQEAAKEQPAAIKESEITPANLKKARVVAYRFALPGDGESELPVESGFSLIDRNGRVDLATLDKLKQAKATLPPGQVHRLVDAVYGRNEKTGAAACYDPHHIFLFYDDSDSLINVVEICFSCTNLHAEPQIEELQWWRHDFRELARICDEVGIGMASGSAEDMIRLWDERDEL